MKVTTHPDVYIVSRVCWQFFATLTFKDPMPPLAARVTMFFSLLREVTRCYGLNFNGLLWVLRSERGETTGREHLHYLLTGLAGSAVKVAACFRQMAWWQWLGGGISSRVRIFDPALGGVDYVLKGYEVSQGSNWYELRKFGGRDAAVMLSKSLGILARGTRAALIRKDTSSGSSFNGGAANHRTTCRALRSRSGVCETEFTSDAFRKGRGAFVGYAGRPVAMV